MQQGVHVNGVGALEQLSFANLLFGIQAERERACRMLYKEQVLSKS
ncbi:MAG: hypothetical protein ACRCWB_10080 [Enterovibrio sp.]